MAKPEEDAKGAGSAQPPRARVTAEESLRRTRAFAAERKEKFVAAIRKSKG
jgi:hypothetical protein